MVGTLQTLHLGEDLVVELAVHVAIERAADRRLGEGSGPRREGREFVGQRVDRGIEPFLGSDLAHQADCQRFRRLDDARGHHHVGRAPEADQPRQEVAGRHVAARQRQLDEGGAQPRRVGRDAEIAGDGQPQSAAEHVAVQSGDHRLANARDRANRVEVVIDRAFPVVGGAVDHLADVGTGAERPAGPGEDDGAHFGIPASGFERIGQRLEQGQIDGVELVGTVESETKHTGAVCAQQRVGHRFLLRIA